MYLYKLWNKIFITHTNNKKREVLHSFNAITKQIEFGFNKALIGRMSMNKDTCSRTGITGYEKACWLTIFGGRFV